MAKRHFRQVPAAEVAATAKVLLLERRSILRYDWQAFEEFIVSKTKGRAGPVPFFTVLDWCDEFERSAHAVAGDDFLPVPSVPAGGRRC